MNQSDFAIILGVTQATVARWESESDSPKKTIKQPLGDTARRIELLEMEVRKRNGKAKLREILGKAGGLGVVAGLLAWGSSARALGAAGGLFGPLGIVAGAAGGLLLKVLNDARKGAKMEESKTDERQSK